MVNAFLLDIFRSANRISRQERLQEVSTLIEKLTERQVMLIKKRRELESNKQPVLEKELFVVILG
jgi:hypothetical protein